MGLPQWDWHNWQMLTTKDDLLQNYVESCMCHNIKLAQWLGFAWATNPLRIPNTGKPTQEILDLKAYDNHIALWEFILCPAAKYKGTIFFLIYKSESTLYVRVHYGDICIEISLIQPCQLRFFLLALLFSPAHTTKSVGAWFGQYLSFPSSCKDCMNRLYEQDSTRLH